MTTRKPPGLPWEDYLTRQIREAEAEGAFANLPGAGKPIEGLDGPYDEMWWLKAFLKREGLDLLPEALALKREAEKLMDGLPRMSGEVEVRAAAEALNTRIRRHHATTLEGGPVAPGEIDVEAALDRWRLLRKGGGT